MTKIKAVIFDWGGVLIDLPTKAMFSHFSSVLGTDEGPLLSFYRKHEHAMYKDEIKEQDFWDAARAELGLGKAGTSGLWYEGFSRAYAPRAGMFELVAELKRKGIMTCLLSNAEAAPMQYFHDRKYPMFDSFVFSCAEGVMKPDKAIYEIALKKLGVKPEEAVFIDDVKKNVDGAKSIGMHGILFTTEGQLREELARLIGETGKK